MSIHLVPSLVPYPVFGETMEPDKWWPVPPVATWSWRPCPAIRRWISFLPIATHEYWYLPPGGGYLRKKAAGSILRYHSGLASGAAFAW